MGKSWVVSVVRGTRVATIGLLAGALMLSGASVALAEDAPPSDASAASADATASSPASDVTPVGDPPSSPPAPVQSPTAPEQRAMMTQTSTALSAPADALAPVVADAPVDAPDDAQSDSPAEMPPAETPDDTQMKARSTATAEIPALRWQTIDSAGAIVPGATVTLEGPRAVDIEDLGGDEQWADAAATTVEDNIGATDYVGLDLDPAPGLFRIEQFADQDDEQAVAIAVVPGSDYRVRPLTADGFITGDDAKWTALTVLTDAVDEAQDVTLAALEPVARGEITPMLVGPDGPGGAAITPPYVYWTVKAGSTLVGGSSFNIQGPRDNSRFFPTWAVNSATIVDNGPEDLDKDNGEFLVKTFDGHSIQSDRRYRIQQTQAPSGYRFTQNNNWVEISGDRQAPNANQWPGDIHDFGNFPVEKLPSYTPVCQAGYAYAISDSGQLQQIVNGTRTSVGTSLSSSDMNGLGIAAGGNSVFAIKRTGSTNSQTATVYRFNTATGSWANTSHQQSTTVSLVAGAVNLSNGAYVFGGFSSDGSQFRMWRYNPGSGTFSYLGYIQTNMGDGSNNGDIAFNAAGDLFVIHGRGNSVTVFSVTAANFNAANGGLIPSATSATVATNSSNVNGVAFDASGKSYLGSSTQLRSYDMPNWSNGSLVTNNLDDSTDLATCSSPATIKLQKKVNGSRAVASDQFTLDLKQGGTTLGTATTVGNAAGVQPQVVGPLPVVRGATLTFSEAFVNGATSSNYATSYQCLVDGEPMSPAVTGTTASGSVTIPNIGEAIVCEFVNTPLTASVVIKKQVQDTAGQNTAPGAGWTVDAVPTASAGSVIRTPNSAQQTNGSGAATWPLTFGTAGSRATVNVSETQQTGYEFVSGECIITPTVGGEVEVELTTAAATPLPGVAPGDKVECTYVNKQIPGSISWEKHTDDVPPANIAGSTWTVQGPGSGGATVTVDDCVGATPAACATSADKDERPGFLKVTKLAWGTYTITETVAPTGFELDGTPRTVKITAENAAAGVTMDPIVNVRKLGSATWSKVVTGTSTLLGGSEWTITGPGFTAPNNVIEDCIESVDADCTGLDKDSAAGKLRIIALAWGDYTLVESAAPLGYILDPTPHNFTVDAKTVNAVIDLGAFENTLATAVALPLTGGLGSDFYLFLGLGVLLLALALLIARRVGIRRQSADAGAQ